MASGSATNLDQRGRHGTLGFSSYIYHYSRKSPNDNIERIHSKDGTWIVEKFKLSVCYLFIGRSYYTVLTHELRSLL
jgi:hypothetical protein